MLSSPPHRSAVWSVKHSSGSAGGTEEETAGKKKQAEIPCGVEGRCPLQPLLSAAGGRSPCPGAGPPPFTRGRISGGREERKPTPGSGPGLVAIKAIAAVVVGVCGSLAWVCHRGEAPAAHLPPPPAARRSGHACTYTPGRLKHTARVTQLPKKPPQQNNT